MKDTIERRGTRLPLINIFVTVVMLFVTNAFAYHDQEYISQDPIYLTRPGSLLGYYQFESQGEIGADSSFLENDASSINAPQHIKNAGKTANGLYMDGNSGLSIPIDINPRSLSQVTLGGWVRLTSAPAEKTERCFLSHNNGGYDRGICMVGPQWAAYTGETTTGTLISESNAIYNRWTFVAAVYTEDSVTLYIDGVSQTAATSVGAGDITLTLGGSTGFIGMVDSIFVYNTALTGAELKFRRHS